MAYHVVNRTAEKLLGCSREELIDRNLAEIIHMAGKKETVPIRRAMEIKAPVEFSGDAELVAPDGSRFHAAGTVSPILDDAGQVGGAVLMFRDISSEIARSRELQEAQYLLRLLMDNRPCVLWLKDSEDDTATAAQVNRELCRTNKAHMFLTAFLAVLDLESGILTCVNAGHNPPLLKHADGSWKYLRIKHSVVLGVAAKARYSGIPVPLAPGDRLFLYTDGVTEAKNAANELFGEERLQEALDAMTGTPSELIAGLKAKLEHFSAGVPQSDDITMLVLDYFEQS